MGKYNFNDDLDLGEFGERVICEDLTYLGGEFITDNKTNTHDLVFLFKDKIITYECKTDIYRDTGNMFIETECRGKASGIEVTKAEWFVTFYKHLDELWYIKTDKLRDILKNFEHKEITQGGDKGSNTKGILLNRNMFRDEFIVRDSNTHKVIIRKWQKKYKRNLP